MFSRRSLLTLPLLAITLLACAPMAASQPPPRSGQSSPGDDYAKAVQVTAGISVRDARQLALKHGLTAGMPLPPGIRKNLARGKPMPPGIARTRLPRRFITELPHHPGYQWIQAGIDLVLIADDGLIVSVVLQGVFD